jgi:hypothetical protein
MKMDKSRPVLRFLRWVAGLAVLLAPASTFAQSGSNIAGVVRDSSGGVLPGVTVEASSPALIERVRSAVTDGQGLYRIVDLRPGVYTVTFTLPGFSIVRRERLELSASFTATVNAELRVGGLEETITVSGEAPVVDVQNVVSQQVMSRDVIDAIPTGYKSVFHLGVLIPGVTAWQHDVGGSSFTSNQLAIHGSRQQETQLLHDGMDYSNGAGRGGAWSAITTNDGAIQEISLEVGNISAESEMGGVRTNVIPKEGGNTFQGSFSGNFFNGSMQSNNLSQKLIDRGLTSVTSTDKIYDINPSFGGPILRDRVWFFASLRKFSSETVVAGMYYNLTPAAIPPVYTPDTSRPAHNDEINGNESLRLTFQINPKNKISAQYQIAQRDIPGYGYSLNRLTATPEATEGNKAVPSYVSQIGWNSPATNRVLFEAGVAFAAKNWLTFPDPDIPLDQPTWRELTTNVRWGNFYGTYGHNMSWNFNTRFAMSYVTGAHNAKFGFSLMHTEAHTTRDVVNGARTYELFNGLPSRVTLYATPQVSDDIMKANMGLYAQDQWTIRKLTLNLGLRYDYYNAYVPEQVLEPGPNVPNRNVHFDRVDDVPNWKNVSPRFGVSYDLFGDGRTAIKASVGRYVEAPNLTSITGPANPTRSISSTATRSWSDANGDFVPQDDELGPRSNVNFGNSNITTHYASDALTTRGYNWETSASVQHEIAPRISVTAGYFRRWYGNFRTTDNTLLGAGDYDPYCVTAPLDSRLPGGGGYDVCGLFDVQRDKFGLSDNVITLSNNFGTEREVYDGIDLTLSARLPNGITLSGGTSTGRVLTDSCFVVDSPQELLHCKVAPPMQTQVKLLGVLPVPGGVQLAATFQSLPGPQVTASYTARSPEIAPTLGRNLASGGTATIPLIAPGTMFGDRLNQLDFRVSKIVNIGRYRIQGNFDLFNALNASTILAQNNTFGSAWQRPTRVLQGRMIKIGGQLNF